MPEDAKRSISETLKGHKVSEETRQKISTSLLGKGYPKRKKPEPISQEARKTHSRNAFWSFRGGETGKFWASLLCPLGYLQEYRVYKDGRRFVLDFALPSVKICFELDGEWHATTPEQDEERDNLLRSMGWKVIRVKH